MFSQDSDKSAGQLSRDTVSLLSHCSRAGKVCHVHVRGNYDVNDEFGHYKTHKLTKGRIGVQTTQEKQPKHNTLWLKVETSCHTSWSSSQTSCRRECMRLSRILAATGADVSPTETSKNFDPASSENSPLQRPSAILAWLGARSYHNPMTSSSSRKNMDFIKRIIHSFDDLPDINAAKAALLSQKTATSCPASKYEKSFKLINTTSVSNSAIIVLLSFVLTKEISTAVSQYPK